MRTESSRDDPLLATAGFVGDTIGTIAMFGEGTDPLSDAVRDRPEDLPYRDREHRPRSGRGVDGAGSPKPDGRQRRILSGRGVSHPRSGSSVHCGLHSRSEVRRCESGEVVVCLDEKTQIQALERTQPILPMRPGQAARRTRDYRRNGLVSLYAALEVASGNVIGECSERHTGADFLRFLKLLNRTYRGRELHVVVDNSSTHSTPGACGWLEAHPNIHLHFTPTGASWLNMVEAWFGILTRKSIRRESFPSVKSLIRHIAKFIERWNQSATPFVWTKKPAEIIRKAVRRAVNMTSGT